MGDITLVPRPSPVCDGSCPASVPTVRLRLPVQRPLRLPSPLNVTSVPPLFFDGRSRTSKALLALFSMRVRLSRCCVSSGVPRLWTACIDVSPVCIGSRGGSLPTPPAPPQDTRTPLLLSRSAQVTHHRHAYTTTESRDGVIARCLAPRFRALVGRTSPSWHSVIIRHGSRHLREPTAKVFGSLALQLPRRRAL